MQYEVEVWLRLLLLLLLYLPTSGNSYTQLQFAGYPSGRYSLAAAAAVAAATPATTLGIRLHTNH